MSEVNTSPSASFLQHLPRYTAPIIAVALGLFAFHWQALHAESRRVSDRAEVRAQTLADTAMLGLREPMLSHDVPAVMILVESLVRENHDVLSARVGGKDGKAIAEREAEQVDPLDACFVRGLRQPILLRNETGDAQAIGVLDLEVSTKEAEQLASANTQLLFIEGGLCVLLCGGLIVWSRKRGAAIRSHTAHGAAASSTPSGVPGAKIAEPMSAREQREKQEIEPLGLRPASQGSAEDEAVEVSLNSPPPSADSH